MIDERRDDVVTAIATVLRTHRPAKTADMPKILADAALAAIDAAEPTDAEIEAADDAFWREFERPGFGQLAAMRAALIAARKAQT